MKRHRFIGSFNLSGSTLVVRDGAFFNQCKNVLRLRPGEEVMLGDGKGQEARAKIVSYSTRTVSLKLLERIEVAREVPVGTVLYAALLKNENFEFVVEKATEVGIDKIVPLITARTVKKGMKRSRLETIMREASEQSGRAHLPVLGEAMTLKDALIAAGETERMIFFDASGVSLSEVPSVGKGSSLSLFIGPEGGWNTSEVAAAHKAGCTVVSLGRLTLRAETAATIVSYLGARGLL